MIYYKKHKNAFKRSTDLNKKCVNELSTSIRLSASK